MVTITSNHSYHDVWTENSDLLGKTSLWSNRPCEPISEMDNKSEPALQIFWKQPMGNFGSFCIIQTLTWLRPQHINKQTLLHPTNPPYDRHVTRAAYGALMRWVQESRTPLKEGVSYTHFLHSTDRNTDSEMTTSRAAGLHNVHAAAGLKNTWWEATPRVRNWSCQYILVSFLFCEVQDMFISLIISMDCAKDAAVLPFFNKSYWSLKCWHCSSSPIEFLLNARERINPMQW